MQTGQQHAGLDEKAYLGGNAFPTMPCVLSAGHYIPSSNLSLVPPSSLHTFCATNSASWRQPRVVSPTRPSSR